METDIERLAFVSREKKLLSRFDLLKGQIAEDALMSLFTTRKELMDDLDFDEAFWNALTPEKTFLVRVFVDHCLHHKDEARLERVLPVVTTLALKLQEELDDLVTMVPEDVLQPGGVLVGNLEDMDNLPDGYISKAFIVAELCKLAVGLDYADEIGRRKMFQLASK